MKMEFLEAEKQVLLAIRSIIHRKETPNPEILENMKEEFGEELVEWTEAFESLTKKGILISVNNTYSLTAQGHIYAQQLVKERGNQEFSKWMTTSENSQAYSTFCERVYGKDLCQLNMMTIDQLEKLLDVLDLDEQNQVLELGCGIGTITEYISDRTHATVTGIDFARGAIQRAQERTVAKRHRLAFQEGDMDHLTFPPKSFDTIIAIDTLYFVEDLEHTINTMKEIVKSGGQMGIFYSAKITPEESQERLSPEKTALAEMLQKYHLRFQTWDFTEREQEFWRESKYVAEELKSAFEAEGNLDLYKSRIRESERELEAANSGRKSRYLYHVQI